MAELWLWSKFSEKYSNTMDFLVCPWPHYVIISFPFFKSGIYLAPITDVLTLLLKKKVYFHRASLFCQLHFGWCWIHLRYAHSYRRQEHLCSICMFSNWIKFPSILHVWGINFAIRIFFCLHAFKEIIEFLCWGQKCKLMQLSFEFYFLWLRLCTNNYIKNMHRTLSPKMVGFLS